MSNKRAPLNFQQMSDLIDDDEDLAAPELTMDDFMEQLNKYS